jgi:anti-anti-sigma factor
VLVADDNADMREYLQRLLEARYDVRAVPDGLAALKAARTEPPDLIVSDVMMPGMDGVELVSALRADPRTARVPVLLLSARAGQEAAAEGLTAGADDYVVKPFTAGELLARIGAHLQLGQLRQQAEQRLELLQQATAALSAAATPAEVAQAAISHLADLLDAPVTILYEVRETGTLEWVAGRGCAPEVQANWSTVPLSAPVPAAEAARQRRPVWLESLIDRETAYPHVAQLIAVHGYQAQVDLPLVIDERCVGVLVAALLQPRRFEEAERAAAELLAEQCAQALHRARLLVTETTARVTAERLNSLVGALSGATEVREVVQVILDYAAELGAAAAVVVWRGSADPQLTVLGARGYPGPTARVGVDSAHPLAHAVCTAQPVWLGSRSSMVWHDDAFESGGPLPVQVAVPLVVGDTAFGALGMRFADPVPAFTPQEHAMILTLGGQCAQALDRARLYQAEHAIAQTLQRSLLPGQTPTFDRLALATRYLPGAADVAAGGDWYDVLALDEQQVAIVVGDVVGQGAAAAAVMGQLRTALSAYLLDGHGPAAALERLDRLAARVPGALASTAAVMILDLGSGQLCWARAGHPPPLLIEHDHVCYLPDGAGGPLGVPRRPPYTEAATRIEPGACLLLYTDGLIERRGQAIDEGLDHLAATAAELCGQPPTTLLDGLLARALPDTGPADDIAMIAALYLPAPLHQRLPAGPEQLPGLRRAVRGWIRAAALPPALGDDLQITVGEAAANAVEHAYATAGEPGEFTYRLTHRGDGTIDVEMRDFGRWRPESPDRHHNHHRGRGLAILRELATDVVVNPSSQGTQVRFRLPAPGPTPEVEPLAPIRRPQPTSAAPSAPAELHIHPQPDGGQRLELRGELDLPAATALRERLLETLTRPGPATLDLRALTYLSSAGIGLVIQAVQHAAERDLRLVLQLAPHSLAARILALSGLDTTVPVITDVAGSA